LDYLAAEKQPMPVSCRLEERNRNLPEGAFEIPKAEMDRYITIFQPLTGDELV
jgi:hypothetical protein